MLMEGGYRIFLRSTAKLIQRPIRSKMRVGETIKFRIIGTNNNFIHPMHMHGGPFTVVARDGIDLPLAARFQADVVNVGPGQRYDVIWPAREPGSGSFTATSRITP
jgi:FtsP/CotA-like multicopper oxidase with cupredoxin domain